MQVVTFYSFKGGVGRTMALVNVATELARRGRNVLMVDFDLEAPGIDTFSLEFTDSRKGGVVDFVSEYIETGYAPDCQDYIKQVTDLPNDCGNLWLMPAGRKDGGYAQKLNNLNWLELYEEKDGYLLFEDLKAQWKDTINPDYVLIDSRTGHTDVSGICTRHLPDAVVLLFFPNSQNLHGLKQIVEAIRAEKAAPINKDIHCHFVMSNVPNLDDEDLILNDNIEAFKNELGIEKIDQIVYRYDSLSLLNQVVFTKDRSRSRLAKEYCSLANLVIKENSFDRDNAISLLEILNERGSVRERFIHGARVEAMLKQFANVHAADGEVLFRIGQYHLHSRSFNEAIAFFTKAIEMDFQSPGVFLARAEAAIENDCVDIAFNDVLHALSAENVTTDQILLGFKLIAQYDVDSAAKLIDTLTLKSMSRADLIWVLGKLNTSKSELKIARGIIAKFFKQNDFDEISLLYKRQKNNAVEDADNFLRRDLSFDGYALVLIGTGYWKEAMDLLDCERQATIDAAFNHAMAKWAFTKVVPKDDFRKTLDLLVDELEVPDPNFLQCMAISNWAIGNSSLARDCLKQAVSAFKQNTTRAFSCWRYHVVNCSQFEKDCEQMEMLINNDGIEPRFFHYAFSAMS